MDYYLRRSNNFKVYPIDIPIYLSGENINKPPYKALNYHPDGAHPVVYAPISLFYKVGATVHWDEPTHTINISTNEFLEDKLIALKAHIMAYREILKNTVGYHGSRFNGIVDGKFVFNGIWWDIFKIPNGEIVEDKATLATTFTVGKYYESFIDGTSSSIYHYITNDQGKEIVFHRLRQSLAAEGVLDSLP
ncbi:MAG: hypothetical protein K0Q87_3762 [Neobacillus sp.]|nr:hypothetical protein [Neobacillus sp.]MDF2857911.1 hypothetical protein [Neobacillus sp.]